MRKMSTELAQIYITGDGKKFLDYRNAKLHQLAITVEEQQEEEEREISHWDKRKVS